MVIFLNGSINAGKSTVSKILARKLPCAAILEIDWLRNMIEEVPLEEAIPINIENGVALTKNLVRRGFNVVAAYPLRPEDHEYIMANLKDLDVPVHVFTLAPRMETSLTNRGARELTEWERERIKYHYATGLTSPDFGQVIDNTDQTPEYTAEIILSQVGA